MAAEASKRADHILLSTSLKNDLRAAGMNHDMRGIQRASGRASS